MKGHRWGDFGNLQKRGESELFPTAVVYVEQKNQLVAGQVTAFLVSLLR